MSADSEAVATIGLGCVVAFLMLAWCVFLPAVGLLYCIGFLK